MKNRTLAVRIFIVNLSNENKNGVCALEKGVLGSNRLVNELYALVERRSVDINVGHREKPKKFTAYKITLSIELEPLETRRIAGLDKFQGVAINVKEGCCVGVVKKK